MGEWSDMASQWWGKLCKLIALLHAANTQHFQGAHMISENSVASEEIVINAPAEIVWDVLMDFANYELWNSFCPKMKGEPVVGSALEMQVDLGNGLQEQVEYVTRLEPFHTIVWSMENKPGDPVHADRMQRITPLNASSCRYWSIDEFSGEFVPAMMEAMGEQIERGFNNCAKGLKQRAEHLFSETLGAS
jgi:hypothetical protein